MSVQEMGQPGQSQWFTGTACIDIDHFTFKAAVHDRKGSCKRLLGVFRGAGCHNLDKENRIDAVIPAAILVDSLRISRLERDDLMQARDAPPRLILPPGFKLDALNGRRRIEAAKKFFDENPDHASETAHVWAVDLHLDTLPAWRQRELTEQYRHETRYSEGEIVHQIRSYEDEDKDRDANRWRSRLSASSRGKLNALAQHTELYDAFCEILDMPGQRRGFLLSVTHNMMACNAFPAFLRHARLVLRTWKHIYRDDRDLLGTADWSTITSLEGRVPALCSSDREHISDRYAADQCFTNVRDLTVSQRLLNHSLAIHWRIPSLRTFFDDLLQFVTWNTSIRKILSLPDEVPVHEGLVTHFTPRVNGRQYVQVNQTTLKCCSVDAAQQQKVAAWQLWLFVVRESASLENDKPRRGHRGPGPFDQVTPCPCAWRSFAQLARQVGFASEAIDRLEQPGSERHFCPETLTTADPPTIAEFTTALPGEEIRRRSGRVFEEGYLYNRSCLFLPVLANVHETENRYVTSLFTIRSQMQAYLGTDWSGVQSTDDTAGDVHIEAPFCPTTTGLSPVNMNSPATRAARGSEIDELRSRLKEAEERSNSRTIDLERTTELLRVSNDANAMLHSRVDQMSTELAQRAAQASQSSTSDDDQTVQMQDGLESVSAQPWSSPLSQTMADVAHTPAGEAELWRPVAQHEQRAAEEQTWQSRQRAWTIEKETLLRSCSDWTKIGEDRRVQIEDLTKRLGEAQAQLAAYRDEGGKALRNWQQERTQFVARIQTAEKTIAELKAREAEVNRQIQPRKAELASLQATLSRCQNDLTERDKTIREQKAAHTSALTSHKEAMERREGEIEPMRQLVEAKEEEIRKFKASAQAELSSCQTQLDEVRAQRELRATEVEAQLHAINEALQEKDRQLLEYESRQATELRRIADEKDEQRVHKKARQDQTLEFRVKILSISSEGGFCYELVRAEKAQLIEILTDYARKGYTIRDETNDEALALDLILERLQAGVANPAVTRFVLEEEPCELEI